MSTEEPDAPVVAQLAQSAKQLSRRHRVKALTAIADACQRLSPPELAGAASGALNASSSLADRWDVVGSMAPALAASERAGALRERTRLAVVHCAFEDVRNHHSSPPLPPSSSSSSSSWSSLTWLGGSGDELEGARRALGAIARPHEVADRLESELSELVHSDTLARRHALLSLLAGLSRVEPQLGSESLARGSARLIQAAQPLRWKLNRNKGEVREGLCRFLARALTKLCGELADEGKCGKQAAAEWENALHEAEDALSPWLQKKERKHGPYGLQLLTVIRCLVRNSSSSVLKLVDEVIPRGLKDRNVRHAAVQAIVHAARACATRRDLRAEVWPRLQAQARSAALHLRRSSAFAGSGTEQLRESASSLAVACAAVEPPFAVEIAALIASEPSSCIEAASAGLAALLATAQWAVQQLLPASETAVMGTTRYQQAAFEHASVPSHRALEQLCESIRLGKEPLEKVLSESARKQASATVSSVAKVLGVLSLGRFYQNFHAHHSFVRPGSGGIDQNGATAVLDATEDTSAESSSTMLVGDSERPPLSASDEASSLESETMNDSSGRPNRSNASGSLFISPVSVSAGTTFTPGAPPAPPAFLHQQVQDSPSREKAIALPWLLKLMPAVIPEDWSQKSGQRLGGALAQLAMPEDAAAKGEAGQALVRCMRCLKQQRAGMLASVAEHALRLPEHALEQAACRLSDCARAWRRCLDEEFEEHFGEQSECQGQGTSIVNTGYSTFSQAAPGSLDQPSSYSSASSGPQSSSSASSNKTATASVLSVVSGSSQRAMMRVFSDVGVSALTLSTLEGAGLALLAQVDTRVRVAAIDVLEESRLLGVACGRNEGEDGEDLAVKTAVELETAHATNGNWMHALACIARTCATVAPFAAAEARRHAIRRLHEIAGSDSVLRESEVENARQWGLLACLAATAEPRYEDPIAANENKWLLTLILAALRVGPEQQSEEALRVVCEWPSEHLAQCFESLAAMLIDNEGISATTRFVKPAFRKREELRPLVASCVEELVARCGLGRDPTLAWRPLVRLAEDFATDDGKNACKRALSAISFHAFPELAAEAPAAANDSRTLRARRRLKAIIQRLHPTSTALGPTLCGPSWDESEACAWAEQLCDTTSAESASKNDDYDDMGATGGRESDQTSTCRSIGVVIGSLISAMSSNSSAGKACITQAYKSSSERTSDAFFTAFVECYLRERPVCRTVRPLEIISASLHKLTIGTTRRDDAVAALAEAIPANWNSNAVSLDTDRGREALQAILSESPIMTSRPESTSEPKSSCGLRIRVPGDCFEESSLNHFGREQRNKLQRQSSHGSREGNTLQHLRSLGQKVGREEKLASANLAAAFPEHTEEMAEELIRIQRECGSESKRRRALRAAVPWLEGASLQGAPSLVKTMFAATCELDGSLHGEEEAIWQTLSSSPQNVAPCIDYLVNEALTAGASGNDALAHHLRAARRVSIHVANVAPGRTGEHLAHHASTRLSERGFPHDSNRPSQADIALHLATCTAYQLQTDSLPAILHAASVTALLHGSANEIVHDNTDFRAGLLDKDASYGDDDDDADTIMPSDSAKSRDSDSRKGAAALSGQLRSARDSTLGEKSLASPNASNERNTSKDSMRHIRWSRNDSLRFLSVVLGRLYESNQATLQTDCAEQDGAEIAPESGEEGMNVDKHHVALPKPESLIAAAASSAWSLGQAEDNRSIMQRWAEECVSYAQHAASEAACIRSLKVFQLLRPEASTATITSLLAVHAGAIESISGDSGDDGVSHNVISVSSGAVSSTSGAHRCAAAALDALSAMLATPAEQQHAAVLPRAFWGATSALRASYSLGLSNASSSALRLLRDVSFQLLSAGDAEARALSAARPEALKGAYPPGSVAMSALLSTTTEQEATSLLAYCACLKEPQCSKLFISSHSALPCMILLPSLASRAALGWSDALQLARALDSSLAMHLVRAAQFLSIEQQIVRTSSIKAGVEHVAGVIATEWRRRRERDALLDAINLLTLLTQRAEEGERKFSLAAIAGILSGLQRGPISTATVATETVHDGSSSTSAVTAGASATATEWRSRIAHAVSPLLWATSENAMASRVLMRLQTAELPRQARVDPERSSAASQTVCFEDQTELHDAHSCVSELLEIVAHDAEETREDTPPVGDPESDDDRYAMTPINPSPLAAESHPGEIDVEEPQSNCDTDNDQDDSPLESDANHGTARAIYQQHVPAFLANEERNAQPRNAAWARSAREAP